VDDFELIWNISSDLIENDVDENHLENDNTIMGKSDCRDVDGTVSALIAPVKETFSDAEDFNSSPLNLGCHSMAIFIKNYVWILTMARSTTTANVHKITQILLTINKITYRIIMLNFFVLDVLGWEQLVILLSCFSSSNLQMIA
jgi:hypothetical protein